MLKKSFATAAIAIATTAALVPTDATAGDPALGALLGGTIGAAIGHGLDGRDGAIVGGVLGVVAGASIAANSHGYYAPGYYGPTAYYSPAPVYYAPRPYYRVAPVRYAPRPVVVYTQPVAVHRYAPRHPAYATVVVDGRHDGRRDRQPERQWR